MMARVRFTHDFDFKPTDRMTIAYKAGMDLTVKRECADRAIALGKAVEVNSSCKTEEAPEVDDGGRG